MIEGTSSKYLTDAIALMPNFSHSLQPCDKLFVADRRLNYRILNNCNQMAKVVGDVQRQIKKHVPSLFELIVNQ